MNEKLSSPSLPRIDLAVNQEDIATPSLFATLVKDVFNAVPLGEHGSKSTEFTVWHLGTTMVGTFSGPPTRFERDAALVGRSGLDQLLVQLYTEGGFQGFADEEPVDVAAGDVCVFDLTATLRTRTTKFSNISILLPRSVVTESVSDPGRLHGLVLRSGTPFASIIGDHLRSLTRSAASLDEGDTIFVAAATLTLLTTVLLGASRNAKRAPSRGVGASLLRDAMSYIDANIADPEMRVAEIAARLGVSRAVLFRLFAHQGGVESYIRRRRLGGAARDLIRPSGAKRIGEIAQRWGFATDAAFSRAFRKAFGINPRAARQHQVLATLADAWVSGTDPGIEQRFSSWLHGLRG